MRLTRLLVEVVRDRSRIRTQYRSRVRLQDRSCVRYIRIRIRLRDRSRIRLRDRKKETLVVIDCYIETGFGNNLLPFAFADFCPTWRSINDLF